MSRIGKRPVDIPGGVDVKLKGHTLHIKGPKGELERNFHSTISVAVEGTQIVATRHGEDRQSRSLHGLTRSLIFNMVKGVSEGFVRKLEINGVGYKAEQTGQYIRFDLGYSHPIFYELPNGIKAEVDRNNNITLTGVDKEVIGAAAATIRGFRPPEPYKGKGIKYGEEVVVRKVGKSGGR